MCESIVHQIVPALIIVIFSIALLVHFLLQKTSYASTDSMAKASKDDSAIIVYLVTLSYILFSFVSSQCGKFL
jgi:hypothetical protein